MKEVRRFISLIAILLISAAILGGCSGSGEQKRDITISVSAAASLQGPLDEIKKMYEAENGRVLIQYNYGSSGALRKQIEEGAPADYFISADLKNIEELEKKSLIEQGSKTSLLSNDLVLLVGNDYLDKIRTIEDLAKNKVDKISMGTPESVPAGLYAKESLEYYNLWDKVKDKAVYGKDVRQVFSYVESGNVMAGFVYASDAKAASKSTVRQVLDANAHEPIVYGAAMMASCKQKAETKKFVEYIKGQQAQWAFEKYGFKPSMK